MLPRSSGEFALGQGHLRHEKVERGESLGVPESCSSNDDKPPKLRLAGALLMGRLVADSLLDFVESLPEQLIELIYLDTPRRFKNCSRCDGKFSK